jgi:hypothetical protein
VSQKIHPVQPEVFAQGFDIVYQAVATVGGGVFGDCGLAGTAKVEDDQPAMGGQSAEVVGLPASRLWR